MQAVLQAQVTFGSRQLQGLPGQYVASTRIRQVLLQASLQNARVIRRGIPVLAESSALVQLLEHGGATVQWVARLEDGTRLPVLDFAYSVREGQLNQLSLTLDGDLAELFPRFVTTRIQLIQLVYTQPFTVAQMLTTGGATLQDEPSGVTTRIEFRSDAVSLVSAKLSLTFIRGAGNTLSIYRIGRAVRTIRNDLNSLLLFLCREAGFEGELLSDLPSNPVNRVVLTEQTVWSLLTEIAQVYSAVLSLDDRMRAVRLTIPEKQLGSPLRIGDWHTQLSEDSPSSQFYNAVTVNGVSQQAGAASRLLRFSSLEEALVDSPARDGSQALQTTTVDRIRQLRERRPSRTDETTSTVIPGFPLANNLRTKREDFDYNPQGQESQYTSITTEIGSFQETLFPVITTIGAILWALQDQARDIQSTSPDTSTRHFEQVTYDPDLPGLFLDPDGFIAATGIPALYARREITSWAAGLSVTVEYAAALSLTFEDYAARINLSVEIDP